MNIIKYDFNGIQIAEMRSDGIIIRSARDAANVIGQLLERGIHNLILHKKNLCPEMWQVSNGLAEAILKEFTDSGIGVAFVGEFSQYKSKSLLAFMRESDLGSRAFFVANSELAKGRLSKK